MPLSLDNILHARDADPNAQVSQASQNRHLPPLPQPAAVQNQTLPSHTDRRPSTATSASASGDSHVFNTPAASPAETHASNASLYQCAHCLKKYSRPEHLQRHIASHTLGKRFVCDICNKGFGRADLLKRHRNNHKDDDNPDKKRRINTAPGSSRVAHACQACAKARVKCEDNKPCTRCRQRDLICEYASLEAGSAAAMHLLHLSASQSTTPQAHVAIDNEASITTPPNFGSGSMPYQVSQPTAALQGMQHPAAAGITNTQYSQSMGGTPPVLANGPSANNGAAHQLPTPEATADHTCHSHPEEFSTQYRQDHNMLDMQGQPFIDFMQSVLYGEDRGPRSSGTSAAPGAGVLDYYDDASLDMNDIDFGMLDNWNVGSIHDMIAADPNLAAFMSQQPEDPAELSYIRKRVGSIWSESPWRWMPDDRKDNINAERNNLSLGDITSAQLRPDRVVDDKLEPSCRDRIMAIVLEACPNNTILSRVASSFPSVEVMDSLAQFFLAWHLFQVSEFVHFPSFSLNEQHPQWLASVAAAGAISIPVASVRKFGYALEEAVRITLPMVFENNNSKIMDISLVQALIINQDIALWSGNRRRTEIVWCHLNVPIAMVRGRLNFSISKYPVIRVDPADEGDVLEDKWKEWLKRESWKRLSFHLFIRDAQTSMTSLTNPHISFTEMSLPLPAAKELWFAKTAQEWKHHHLKLHAGQPSSQLSLGDLIRDPNLMANEQHRLDVQYCVSIVLHAFWTPIHDYHKLNTMTSDPTLVQSHRAHLVKTLDTFQRLAVDSQPHVLSALSAQEPLVVNLLQMNLHVSLAEIQLFLGKEGDDQAKRTYPALQQWAQGPDSRRAIWHAGQVLRFAREFPVGHLKDFYAVAVHQAALTLWTWGVITRVLRRNSNSGFNRLTEPAVYLDGLDSPHHFIAYGTGRPAIMSQPSKEVGDAGIDVGASQARDRRGSTCFVNDPALCMRAVADIFSRKFPNGMAPPMVENLSHLIRQLDVAPRGMGMG